MSENTFTVDTHLFRELGELLVGRDSTALVELLKNAYDADATQVVVEGIGLSDPENGRIVVTDDGIGMTPPIFRKGFLRVASRIREEGERRSARFNRRFTGAKGVGRLAAHKLARQLYVTSRPDAAHHKRGSKGVEAVIDWDVVETYETLDSLGEDAIEVTEISRTGEVGTTIDLQHLRREWTDNERMRFLAEVQTFQPPDVLLNIPKSAVPSPRLIRHVVTNDSDDEDPGIKIELEGDFDVGDEYWHAVADVAHWLVEIDGRSHADTVDYRIAPTMRCIEELREEGIEDVEDFIEYSVDVSDLPDRPRFHARFLVRDHIVKGISRDARGFVGRMTGIRVYMEGFRVLPYGEPGSDWLDIDSDNSKRNKTLTYLKDYDFSDLPPDEKEGLSLRRDDQYFGAVFLTQNEAPSLRMLVNREGFVPDTAFVSLKHVVRIGVDLSARLSASRRQPIRERRRLQRQGGHKRRTTLQLKEEIEVEVGEAAELASQARVEAAEGNVEEAGALIDDAINVYMNAISKTDSLLTEVGMTRILAAIGTQMIAFVHEVNGLLGIARSVEGAVARLRKQRGLGNSIRQSLGELETRLGDLRRSVERQASYLTDVTAPDARRRKSRQKLAERFDRAAQLVQPACQRRGIRIENEINRRTKTRAMFPAELTLVLANLLTNAVKAAGAEGRIRATSEADENVTRLRIENTGVSVDPRKGERWFRPFESTTTETDPYLGQGMGMGLPIVRNILEEYGGTVVFGQPTDEFATAVVIEIPKG